MCNYWLLLTHTESVVYNSPGVTCTSWTHFISHIEHFMSMCFTTLHQDNYRTSGGRASLKFHSIHTDHGRSATAKGDWEKNMVLKKKYKLKTKNVNIYMTDLKIAGINDKYNYFSRLLGLQLLKLASWRKMNFDQALVRSYMNKVASRTRKL